MVRGREKERGKPVSIDQAEQMEWEAERFCNEGYHTVAAACFDHAAELYRDAGKHLEAARCWAQVHIEMQWARTD